MENKSKPKKQVIAKFVGKGFSLASKNKVSHKSHILYTDKEAYLNDDCEDAFQDALMALLPGIVKLLNDKRVKPGSIRITFSFEK